MSLKAMRWAWETQILSRTQKIILLSMADRANDAGECWPSIRRLCLDTNCSDRTVQRSIKAIEKLGLIVCERVSGKTTVYKLLEAPLPPEDPRHAVTPTPDMVTPLPRHDVTPTPDMVTPTPDTVTPDPRHSDTQNLKENHKRNQREEGELPPPPASPPAEGKRPYGEFGNVLLTDAEHSRLVQAYGEGMTAEAIELFGLWLGARKGEDPYKNHYLALRKWAFAAVKERYRNTERKQRVLSGPSFDELVKRHAANVEEAGDENHAFCRSTPQRKSGNACPEHISDLLQDAMPQRLRPSQRESA